MERNENKDCERVRGFLPDFAVGAGTSSERAVTQRHLDGCPVCAKEFHAFERTNELLNRTPLERAPDLWNKIKPNLPPREVPVGIGRLGWWLGRYRLQSALALAAATIAVAALFLTGPQTPPEVSVEVYFANHTSISWREPFADKAGLALAAVAPVEVRLEDAE